MKNVDKKTICRLLRESIGDETTASVEYESILRYIPEGEEYEDCAKEISKIAKDETEHRMTLITIAKKLSCPDNEED